MRVAVFVCLVGILSAEPADLHSQERDDAIVRTRILIEFADEVCGKQDQLVVPVAGESQSFELTGEAKVEVQRLLAALVDAGVEGAGTFTSQSNTLLLQDDLKEVLLSGAGCRERIVIEFDDRLFGGRGSLDNIQTGTDWASVYNRGCSLVQEIGPRGLPLTVFENDVSCGTDECIFRVEMNVSDCANLDLDAQEICFAQTDSFVAYEYKFTVEDVSAEVVRAETDGVSPKVKIECGLGNCVDVDGLKVHSVELVQATEACAQYIADKLAPT